MNRRGASHIEIILSFLLFMAAVGAALYFFSPTDSDRLVDSSLTYLFGEIEQNVSVEMDVFSVNTDRMGVIGVDVSGTDAEKQPRVEDIDGNVVDARRDGDIVYFDASAPGSFYTIKLSEEFNSNPPVGGVFDPSFYRISSSDSFEIVSENKFSDLKEYYDEDYTLLKRNFNLPNRINIGFALEMQGGINITAEKEIPDGFEIFSDRKRIEILRADGRSEFAELVVFVW